MGSGPTGADALGIAAERRRVPVHVVQMDVTSRPQIAATVDAILHARGRVDALVQFAGMGLRGFFEDLTLDEIRRVYDVNVFGTMAVTRAILPAMRAARKGRIVITSSVAGRMGSMSISGYSSSKFGVEGFAEWLAQEVAPLGIHVSLLEPGLVFTEHFTQPPTGQSAQSTVDLYYRWFLPA